MVNHRWLTLWLLTLWFVIYLPGIGHGFIKDDFAWISHSSLDGDAALRRLTFGSLGFYRPIVSLSFGLNEAIFGQWSLGYGLTNGALAIGCAFLIAGLARHIGLGDPYAVLAAAIWAFNFHGINMAVLWLSGRTALLLTLFSLLAVWAAARRRPIATFVFSLLALGSKEEAVVLPVLCAVWALQPGDVSRTLRERLKIAAAVAGPALLALIIYLALRAQSGAFTPSTAPAFYQFHFEPALILRNVREYADRSATLAVGVILVALAFAWRRPLLTASDRFRITQSVVWLFAGFAVTLWLPVRSSLYAVWPSVGAVLAAAFVVQATLREVTTLKRVRFACALALFPLLLLPVYWARNVRWVELADVSAAALATVRTHSPAIEHGTVVLFVDDLSTRANLRNAFGGLYSDAARLHFGNRFEFWIDPPPPEVVVDGVSKPTGRIGAVVRVTRDGFVVDAKPRARAHLLNDAALPWAP